MPIDQARILHQVRAARGANQLAVRFTRKGDTFNARQARTLAIRALMNARDIKQGK